MATADTSAMTLDKYAVLSKDPVVEKITMSVYSTGNVLKDIPLVTKPNLRMVGTRYADQFPGVTWGKLNQTPTVVTGKPEQYQENCAIIRNAFQFDQRFLDQPDLIEDPVESDFRAWIQSLEWELNTSFILNDPADFTSGNEDAWIGLRTRLANPITYKLPNTSGTCDLDIDGGAVDMTTSMTATTANTFLEKFQEVLDAMGCSDGRGVVAYMNDKMKRRFARAIRVLGSGGGFTTREDGYDRQVETFGNVKIRDIGRKSDQSTKIIPSTENAAGTVLTASTHTSIYFVRYGPGQFMGWQTNPLKPKNLGLSTENGILNNIVVDWGVGLWIPGRFSIGKLHGINLG